MKELSSAPVRVIAHRGASAYAPENTVAAFQIARAQGATHVELDVQLSSDDRLILFHDRSLEKKTGETGSVRDHSAAHLLSLDIGSWFDESHPKEKTSYAGTTLDSLSNVLERFGDAFYYHVEIKSDAEPLPALLLAELRRFGLQGQVTITSFQRDVLLRIRELDPDVRICQLVDDLEDLRELRGSAREALEKSDVQLQREEIDRARTDGFEQVALSIREVDRELVAYARERGLSVRAWRVKKKADLLRVLETGVEGFTVNWPDRAFALVRARRGPAGAR